MTILRGALLVDGTGVPPGSLMWSSKATGSPRSRRRAPCPKTATSLTLTAWCWPRDSSTATPITTRRCYWNPDLTPSSWHGVTTVVMGNCGFGIAPTRPTGRETIARTLENVEGMSVEALFAGIPWTFETFPEYLDAVERAGPKLNVAVMLGHTPLRLYVLGEEAAERDATSAEIEEMRRLVADALDAGRSASPPHASPPTPGPGASPCPARPATTDELMRLAEPLAERGRGTFAITHGPDFGPTELAELSASDPGGRSPGRP